MSPRPPALTPGIGRDRTTRRRLERTTAFVLISNFLVTCAAFGADDGITTDTTVLELPPDPHPIVAANNAFAVDLYRRLAAAEGDAGSLVFSPFSASAALAMTLEGAAGDTRAEMIRTLYLPADDDLISRRFGHLLCSYAGDDDTAGVQLRIANRLWGQEGREWLPSFLETLREDYHAPLENLRFTADPEAARRRINAWVLEATSNRIQELLAPGVLNPLTRLVLTNAVYFLGRWEAPFDPKNSYEGQFQLASGEPARVRYMNRLGPMHLGEWDDLQVLELPYKTDRFSFVVLLPRDPDGLAELESSLDPAALKARLDSLPLREAEVTLPRFRIQSDYDLGSALQALGISSAFDPNRADFSRMDGTRNLYIDAVLQKAFLEVGERGTEAAAATAVVLEERGGRRMETAHFYADHPFLFLLRDRGAGTILFMGRFTGPAPEAEGRFDR